MLQNCHHRHLLSPVVVTSSCSCHLVYVILLLFVSIPCPVILPCLWGLWRTLNLTFDDSTVWLGLDRLSLDCWYWVTDKHFEVCETTSQLNSWTMFSWTLLHNGDYFTVIIFASYENCRFSTNISKTVQDTAIVTMGILPRCAADFIACRALDLRRVFYLPARRLVAWHSGRTSVSDRRTFAVLRSTCGWRVTTYMGKPSAVGEPTRPTQPFILSG